MLDEVENAVIYVGDHSQTSAALQLSDNMVTADVIEVHASAGM